MEPTLPPPPPQPTNHGPALPTLPSTPYPTPSTTTIEPMPSHSPAPTSSASKPSFQNNTELSSDTGSNWFQSSQSRTPI
eukprot:CAMPEP_0113656950 /NCGR_PEP_ID=MMETSP0017_2-20120614/30739_1 /TAXON_ID=2856 /ORGANISM="Cylindrotheca closterium" /LENGTH=78 /DNA_ID=CAMNT_0000570751 /DNA_START=46 /DNA_END=282 /DNA_ORIENTATION=- /assembly_acc=CAM_ASM_000147